jgi:Protein of unknown function (DUF1553)/Protein of unknown function (DUF1549)/Planctomycete cytochrome C
MRIAFSLLFVLGAHSAFAAEKPSVEQIDFFEKSVRPVFLDHCVRCHGEKKQEAGLRLDSPAGIRKGTDAGPVVVAGDPEKSLLIKSVRRTIDNAMPPDKELPKEKVEALVRWVKVGAAMPEGAQQAAGNPAKDHWAFQPVRKPAVPANVVNPIDHFIREQLRANGLPPASPADRRTLIRRVTFDLIGLPPTFEEVEAFASDASPDAYGKLVDRLLAMPQYGERWARHWMDVARYADTKGYVFTEDRNYPYAYTYREYLIRAFNEDRPYDRFVLEQLAADKLKLDTPATLAAMGFLTVGRRFGNNPHDIIDDRIDLVGRGLMGLSIGCARCHDHKFDPIPIGDYYSLYGVFQSSHEPKDLPLIGEYERTAAVAAFEAELARKEKAAADYEKQMYADALAPFKKPGSIAAMLMATKETQGFANDKADKWAVERKIDPRMLDRWRIAARGHESVFGVWRALSSLPEREFAAKYLETVRVSKGNGIVKTALMESRPANLKETAAVYAELLADAAKETPGRGQAEWQELVKLMVGPEGVTNPPNADADKLVAIVVKRGFRTLRNDAAKFRANAPASPPRAMVMNDNTRVGEPVVFLRGNPNNRGPQVPKRMPAVVAGADRKPFTNGSGRLELAEQIAKPDNPLTARVIVNRIWTWHFGQGLVRTPSDFGLRSDPPTHPELLDWLAATFVEDGWSIKKLHRRIVLSDAYRQSSLASADAAKKDPENRLLSRFNRHRLDFEQLRDALLFSSGQLDRSAVGGKSVDLFSAPFTKRRSLYGFVDRQNLPGTFRAFDFASPEQHTPQRFQTTVPQQALFLMNSPFVVEQAKALAARTAGTTDERVRTLYRLALGRNPNETERKLAGEFVQSPDDKTTGVTGWEQLAQVLLLSNEFAFVD